MVYSLQKNIRHCSVRAGQGSLSAHGEIVKQLGRISTEHSHECAEAAFPDDCVSMLIMRVLMCKAEGNHTDRMNPKGAFELLWSDVRANSAL